VPSQEKRSEEVFFVEVFVEVGDGVGVAVVELGGDALVGADEALGGLRPAGVGNFGIHVGVEAVLEGGGGVPECGRFLLRL